MNRYIKALIIGGLYFSIVYGVGFLLFKNISYEILMSDKKIEVVQLLEYVLFLIAIMIIVKGLNIPKLELVEKIEFAKTVLLVFALAVVLRIINDPIFRLYELTGILSFPDVSEKESNLLSIINIAIFLRIVIITPIIEELVFRKLMLFYLLRRNGTVLIGIIVSSVLYSLIHFEILTMIASFILGFVLAIVYLRYGLLFSILLHVFYNLIWFILDCYKSEYWGIIAKLDFGILYWLFLIMSIAVVIFFIKNGSLLQKKYSAQ